MGEDSRVVSVRLDAGLLEAVRERARADGRSVSGEIVYFVREQIVGRPRAPQKARPITGWLSERPTIETEADFRRAREEVSAQVMRAVREKARRK